MTAAEAHLKSALRSRIRAGRAARSGHAETVRSATGPSGALSSHIAAAIARFRPGAVLGYAALPGEPGFDEVLEELAGVGDRGDEDSARDTLPVLLPATRKGEPLRLGRLAVPIDRLPARIWGIREPAEALPALEALAALLPGFHDAPVLVLVPGLAYDSRGVRLGNGGGFYDRTFGPAGVIAQRAADGDPVAADVLGRLRFLGVCWEDERAPALPREDWDLVVDAVLTETGLHPADPA